MSFPLGLTRCLQAFNIAIEKFCAISIPNPSVQLFFFSPFREDLRVFSLSFVLWNFTMNVKLVFLIHCTGYSKGHFFPLKDSCQLISIINWKTHVFQFRKFFYLFFYEYLSKFLLPVSSLSLSCIPIIQYWISNLLSFCLFIFLSFCSLKSSASFIMFPPVGWFGSLLKWCKLFSEMYGDI